MISTMSDIEPTRRRRVARAIITHGHSDHARPGHRAVLATADTLAVMRARMGEDAAGAEQHRRRRRSLDEAGDADAAKHTFLPRLQLVAA